MAAKRTGKSPITTHPSQLPAPQKINKKKQASIEKYKNALSVFEGVTTKAALKQLQARGIDFTQEGFRSFAKIGTDTLYGEIDMFNRLQKKLQAVRDGRWSQRAPPGSGWSTKYEELNKRYQELKVLFEASLLDNAKLIRMVEYERERRR